MKEEINYNRIKIINQVESLKNEIEKYRPVTKEIEDRIFQKYRLDWNYNSCSIEGNSLDYGETTAFLMYGLTAKGKPLKDHLDIRGHNDAINFLLDLIKNNENFTEKDIRSLHEMILVEPYETEAITQDGNPTKKLVRLGVYKNTPNHVKTPTGEIHYYVAPEETPIKMHELMEWYRSGVTEKEIHPVILASFFHYKIASIHPFDDGNGRIARLIMNLILMKSAYPPVVIKQKDKMEYYSVLSQADAGNFLPFIEFICKNLVHSLEIYLKGVRGESIDEPGDFEKELELFKKEVEGRNDKLECKRTIEVQKELADKSFGPFINCLKSQLDKLNDLFLSNNYWHIEQDYNLEFQYYSLDNTVMREEDGLTYSGLENYLYDRLSNSIDFRSCILSFGYNEFRSLQKLFGFEIKIFFTLEDYKYEVSYSVSDYLELENKQTDLYKIRDSISLTNGYYHQQITEEEIEKFCGIITKQALSYIKNYDDNPEARFAKIEQESLDDLWNDFLLIIKDDNKKNILKGLKPTYIEYNRSIYFPIAKSKDISWLKSYLLGYTELVRKKLNIKKNIGISFHESPRKMGRIIT